MTIVVNVNFIIKVNWETKVLNIDINFVVIKKQIKR